MEHLGSYFLCFVTDWMMLLLHNSCQKRYVKKILGCLHAVGLFSICHWIHIIRGFAFLLTLLNHMGLSTKYPIHRRELSGQLCFSYP